MPACPFCAKQIPDESFVCPHCLRAQPVVIPTSTRAKSGSQTSLPKWLRPMGLAIVLVGLGAYAFRDYHRAPPPAPEPELAPAPSTITVAAPLGVDLADSAAAKIAAGGHLAFPFTGHDRSECRVRGSVQGLTGGDRQVEVFVVDRDGLADYEAGRSAHRYYESGSTSGLDLDIKVDGRTQYALVVANAGARSRPKTVRLRNLRADCQD